MQPNGFVMERRRRKAGARPAAFAPPDLPLSQEGAMASPARG
eukprot:CAMPEP_0197899720 /NCGR_PEP_ID=MMETSP1439-20131203/47202_1 /TAXON_ID=66791 /ORGANISM="Gonyaulax spinifera, Strain CCMP409" /LENGTH=41 /DNA_ID= /DNA_START= /DNA_END= /DNA_ORIENTATION=